MTIQLAAYQALFELGQAQRAALDEPELDRFFALAEEREALFGRLKVAEGEPLGPEDRARIQDLIKRILETDREIEAEVLRRQEATRQEIAALQPGMNALAAYLQESDRGSFFIDRNH
jgi:hypothetical protein